MIKIKEHESNDTTINEWTVQGCPKNEFGQKDNSVIKSKSSYVMLND